MSVVRKTLKSRNLKILAKELFKEYLEELTNLLEVSQEYSLSLSRRLKKKEPRVSSRVLVPASSVLYLHLLLRL
jgi:hypothetical protein